MAIDCIRFNPQMIRSAFPLDMGLSPHLGAEKEALSQKERVLELTNLVAARVIKWVNPITRCLGYTESEDLIRLDLTLRGVEMGVNVYGACSEKGLPSITSLKSHMEGAISLLENEMKGKRAGERTLVFHQWLYRTCLKLYFRDMAERFALQDLSQNNIKAIISQLAEALSPILDKKTIEKLFLEALIKNGNMPASLQVYSHALTIESSCERTEFITHVAVEISKARSEVTARIQDKISSLESEALKHNHFLEEDLLKVSSSLGNIVLKTGSFVSSLRSSFPGVLKRVLGEQGVSFLRVNRLDCNTLEYQDLLQRAKKAIPAGPYLENPDLLLRDPSRSYSPWELRMEALIIQNTEMQLAQSDHAGLLRKINGHARRIVSIGGIGLNPAADLHSGMGRLLGAIAPTSEISLLQRSEPPEPTPGEVTIIAEERIQFLQRFSLILQDMAYRVPGDSRVEDFAVEAFERLCSL
ncbi:MAG: hypothetical protein NTX49_07440 [Chlamydiae bacterium]|nr:hypothetical protein [Chlamydiota bacterium]